MPRRLSAIDIAEGALLADIAVIFQLIWTYLPPIGLLFRPLIPVVFTILVLRRSLYTGILSACVAFFLAGVITGPNFLALLYMLLEGIGGLYLGWAMKRRMADLPLLLMAILGAGVGVSVALLVVTMIWLPPAEIALGLHRIMTFATSILQFAAAHLGFGGWWLATIAPILPTVEKLALAYWIPVFFVYNILVFVPVVPVIYLYTNVLARLLGYDVRPFPAGRIGRLLNRIVRAGIALGRRYQGIVRRRATA